jgi:ribonuclease P protein component
VTTSGRRPYDASMADPPRRYTLTKRQKLRRPAEFRKVYESGAKAGDDHLLVFAMRNDLGVTRIGLSVSRKHGSAVARNRIKRLLREAFRLDQHDLPVGLDLILIPRPDTEAGLGDYRRSLVGCVRRLMKRLPPPAPEAPAVPKGTASENVLPEASSPASANSE